MSFSKPTYRARWIDKLIGQATRMSGLDSHLDEDEEGYYVTKKGHKIFICIFRDIVGEWNEVAGFYVLNNGDAVRVRTRTDRTQDVTNPLELFVATNLKEF